MKKSLRNFMLFLLVIGGGILIASCSGGNFESGGSDSDHVHEYSTDWKHDDDNHWKECSCGDKTDVDEHVFNNWITVTEATASSTGLKRGACSECAYSKEEVVPKLDHTHEYTETIVNPSCTKKGYTLHSCNKCADQYKDNYVDELGHQYGEWVIVKDATLSEDGLKQRTCSVCEDVQEEKIDKIGGNEKVSFVTEDEIIADDIKLGMTQREVMNVLGDPDETSDGVWYWYENSFAKKYAEANALLQSSKESDWVKGAEMMDELLKMTFECTMIKFNSSAKTVEEYFYDENHKYSSDSDYESANKKELKSLKIANFDSIDYYESDVENYEKINFDLKK